MNDPIVPALTADDASLNCERPAPDLADDRPSFDLIEGIIARSKENPGEPFSHLAAIARLRHEDRARFEVFRAGLRRVRVRVTVLDSHLDDEDKHQAHKRREREAAERQAAARAKDEAAVLVEPEPTVDLAALVDDLVAYVHRYVVLTPKQAIVVALWTAHTHVLDAADATPYLAITSATKRAGKTRLLEVLEPVVARPWFTGRASAAILPRKIDAERSTLLLDESDAAFKQDSDYTEALRSILNSGYRRSGRSSLCVGKGTDIGYRDFKTFGAKALAGIGALPDTVADRSISIQLRRRTSDEPIERYRTRDARAAADPIRAALDRWRRAAVPQLREARPKMPSELDDRACDCCEPLLAIADLAGGDWPSQARSAVVALCGAREDHDIVVELLRDVADFLPEHAGAVIATKDLLAMLTALEDRPWAAWRHDKPITGRGLARLLGPLGIHPGHLERVRGYRRDAFDDAIARYLPSQVSMCQNAGETGPKPAISMCREGSANDTCKIAKQADFVDEMTHGHIDRGETAEAPLVSDRVSEATEGDDFGRPFDA